MNILAIEVSTSSAKTLVYSTEEGIKKANSIPYGEDICDVETIDPGGMYYKVIECVQTILERIDCTIDAIGLGSTFHSMLFLDQNREPEGKIMTWAHTEAAQIASKYRKDKKLSEWIYKKTGCVVHSLYPLWKWVYFRDKEDSIVNENILVSSQPGYIFEKLTGEIGVSRSVASGTGLMNIHTLEWDEEILQFADLRKDQLSPLKDPDYSATLLSEEAEKLGVPAGIPVVITNPDGALNQVGSGALKKGIMTMSVGTSAALRIAYDKPILSRNQSTWCYYVGEGKRLAGAAISGAGNCIDWFVQKVNQNVDSYSILDKKAANINQLDAPIFLPFLYGERCPGWNDKRRGGYFDLRGNDDIDSMYYSILEGILFNLYQCYRFLIQVGEVPDQIRISGGIENSSRWLQMAADIFKKEVYTSNIKHASLMGSIGMVLKVTGEIDSLEEFEPEQGKKITPNPEKFKIYRQRYDKYLDYYQITSE